MAELFPRIQVHFHSPEPEPGSNSAQAQGYVGNLELEGPTATAIFFPRNLYTVTRVE